MRLALIILATTLAAPASAAQPSAVIPCSITAYAVDQDPKGLNVRAGPSGGARVIKRVSNDDIGVVAIRGFRDGWFRVSRIDAVEADDILFRGDGWVHRSLLHLDVAAADQNLYAAPSPRARRVRKLAGDQPGVTLVGCKGDWAQVRVDGALGWLSPAGQCSNARTTCA